jgi:hypothetical protein
MIKSMDRWQFRVRTFRRLIRGWAANEVAAQNKNKVELSKEFTRLESLLKIGFYLVKSLESLGRLRTSSNKFGL